MKSFLISSRKGRERANREGGERNPTKHKQKNASQNCWLPTHERHRRIHSTRKTALGMKEKKTKYKIKKKEREAKLATRAKKKKAIASVYHAPLKSCRAITLKDVAFLYTAAAQLMIVHSEKGAQRWRRSTWVAVWKNKYFKHTFYRLPVRGWIPHRHFLRNTTRKSFSIAYEFYMR